MAIYALGDKQPRIATDCYVAEEATIIGDVTLESGANVWPGAVLRGDVEPIIVGPRCSIQDGAVLHTDPGCPLTIAADVTIGHQATLHGCTIEAGALVGMQAVVLNRSVIGAGCLVGAASLVPEDKTFAAGWLLVGTPARKLRELTADERENLLSIAARYVQRAALYREQLKRID